jgi:hypothetical protein
MRRLELALDLSGSVGREYLRPGERPPRGAAVQTGPRGGKFYEGGPLAEASGAGADQARRWRKNVDEFIRAHGRAEMDRVVHGVLELAAGRRVGREELRRCVDCGGARPGGVCRSGDCPAASEWRFVEGLLRGLPPATGRRPGPSYRLSRPA